jgi:hypothetical protein
MVSPSTRTVNPIFCFFNFLHQTLERDGGTSCFTNEAAGSGGVPLKIEPRSLRRRRGAAAAGRPAGGRRARSAAGGGSNLRFRVGGWAGGRAGYGWAAGRIGAGDKLRSRGGGRRAGRRGRPAQAPVSGWRKLRLRAGRRAEGKLVPLVGK